MRNESEDKRYRVLLCLDMEAGSGKLAGYAADRARRCGDTVHILHVVRPDASGEEIERAGARVEGLVQDRMDCPPPETVEIIPGIPEDVIISKADLDQTDLIILGRRARSTVERIYVGSTTSAVISLARRPVLVVPLGRDYIFREKQCD